MGELSIAPVLTAGLVVLTDQAPPPNLMDLSADCPRRPSSSGAARVSRPRSTLGRRYAEAAGLAAEVWEVPGAAHIGGIDTAPEDYERHVVDFLDRHLLAERRSRDDVAAAPRGAPRPDLTSAAVVVALFVVAVVVAARPRRPRALGHRTAHHRRGPTHDHHVTDEPAPVLVGHTWLFAGLTLLHPMGTRGRAMPSRAGWRCTSASSS